jgi:hypothetical protein
VGVVIPVTAVKKTVGQFLDDMIALAPTWTWGVNASRKVFIAPAPTNTVGLDEANGVIPEFEECDAERLVSAVNFVLGKTVPFGWYGALDQETSPDLEYRRLGNQTWGRAWDTKTIAPLDGLKDVAGQSVSLVSGTLLSGSMSSLSDGNPATGIVVRSDAYDPTTPLFEVLSFEVDLPANTTAHGVLLRWDLDWVSEIYTLNTGSISIGRRTNLTNAPNGVSLMTIRPEAPGDTVKIRVLLYPNSKNGQTDISIRECRVLQLDTARLNAWADSSMHYPATNPVSIFNPGLVGPCRYINLTRRNSSGGVSETLNGLEVATLEYRITAEEYEVTTVKCGQAFSADELAQAAIINGKARAAFVDAVRIAR